MTSLSRKRALQDLTNQRTKNSSTNFPSLFDIAIQTCISHLEVYGTFDGLPFRPFGQPLFEEFIKRASQWRLTTEQRQAGIVLLSESYGEHFLGPEYTGIRCSLQDDIPLLGAFAECLVYLDLSGGCVAGNSPGLEDKDVAFLSGLSHLKVLNLAGLKIGDVGLSHLVRSVTFGSSGPALLEYLNLAGTDVSHRGVSRLWSSQKQHQHQQHHYRYRPERQLVFRRLLGIDLSGTAVLPSLAETLFQEKDLTPEEGGWTKLGRNIELFPSQTLQEQQSASGDHPNSYYEQENGLNPMQKWVDRLNRIYKLTFGQRPDLAGDDGLGLSECLALSKLGQVHILPLAEPLAPHQAEYIRRGEEMRRNFAEARESRKRTKKRTKYGEGDDSGDTRASMPAGRGRPLSKQQTATSLANSDKNTIIGENGLDHMYNLNMYQKVLASIRLTFGTRNRPVASNGKSSSYQEGLAFVRVRSAVERQLVHLELEDVEMEESQSLSQQRKRKGGEWSAGMGPNGVEVSTIARLKTQYHRLPPMADKFYHDDSVSQDSHMNSPIKQEGIKTEPQDYAQDNVKIEPQDHAQDVYKQEEYRQELPVAPKPAPFNPFTKASTSPTITRTSSWVFSSSTSPAKQRPPPSQQPQGPPVGNLPTRRRGGQEIGSSYQFQPFIKPATEQASSAIFITQRSPRKDEVVPQKQHEARSTQKPIMMIKTRADQKPAAIPRSAVFTKSGAGGGGGSSMMQRWVKQEQQPQAKPTHSPLPSPVKNNPFKAFTGSSGAQDKKPITSASVKTQPSVIREFHFKDTKRDTVNLDRWIRTGGAGSSSTDKTARDIAVPQIIHSHSNPFKVAVPSTSKEPTKAIRYDPRDALFADDNNDNDNDE
ncbi:hypothetical protein BGZ95_000779 [Linnemannia exigua]|uniref:Uncharacterized protein n=1 Tax=Linnemannia exigua TaxID=604196 RepID=A0AAD4D7T2_9FUNG|nr:hypothetical protein BGZ95_000779 [Linnemannia exigua]